MFFAESLPEASVALNRLPRLTESVWDVPGSKVITNRALVLAALADGTSVLEGALQSDDTRYVRATLEALGVGFTQTAPTTLVVEGGRSRLRAPERPISVGNSTSALRFVTALAALVDGEVTLVGNEKMKERSLSDLLSALSDLGVAVQRSESNGAVTVKGDGRFPGGTTRIRGDRSSQYLSAILLSAGLASQDVEIELTTPLVGRGYVDLTIRMIEAFGGKVEIGPDVVHVKAVGAYRPCRYIVEPDACSASYAFALAAGAPGTITVPRLGQGSLQGEARFADVLRALGARVEQQASATVVTGAAQLKGIEVDMQGMPETVATLAAIAPLAKGPMWIRNIGELRDKAFDRLAAIAAELEKLGQSVVVGKDDLRIVPRPITAAVVASRDDHQLGMSFAILGALRGGVTIDSQRCVAKSYPGFWHDLGTLYRKVGADLHC